MWTSRLSVRSSFFFPGLSVAAHQYVALAPADDIDSCLDNILAGLGSHQGVGLVLQAQTLQHRLNFFGFAYQNGGGKSRVLRLKGAEQNVLSVRAGDDHAHLAEGPLGPFHDLVEILHFHDNWFSFLICFS